MVEEDEASEGLVKEALHDEMDLPIDFQLILDRLTGLSQDLAEANLSLETFCVRVEDLSETAQQGIRDHADNAEQDVGVIVDEILTCQDLVLVGVRGVVERGHSLFDTWHLDLETVATDQILQPVLAAVGDSTHDLESSLTGHETALLLSTDQLRESVLQGVEELRNYAVESIVHELHEQVRLLLEDVATKLESEIVDAIVLTHLQAELTSAMSPYLPQLAAARIASSAIKEALHVMRMGL